MNTGYSTNFGEPNYCDGNRTEIKGQIIVLTFKDLVTKFMDCREDLNNQEHLVWRYLYNIFNIFFIIHKKK